MGIMQAIKMSIDSILSNKMRSFLTVLGVIIGVAAVIALVSVVDSVTAMITSTLEDMGTNSINVILATGDEVNSVDVDDIIKFVKEKPDYFSGVAPIINGNGIAKYSTQNLTTSITGTNTLYKEIDNIKLEKGRFFNEFDIENREKVAIIGSYVKKELFGEEEAIGKQIKINGAVFDVLAVMEEKQSSVKSGQDDIIYVPYTTLTRLLKNKNVNNFVAKAISSEKTADAKKQLSDFLEEQLESKDLFIIITQDEILEQVNSITGTLRTMLGGIAAISLLVGGIGIMNIMLVSVSERTREIGIRKAIGAKRRSILTQFLIEAVILSLLGGILGIIFGWGITSFVGKILEVETVVKPSIIIFALAFSMAIGVFFGLYPANKASKLNPIDALRYE